VGRSASIRGSRSEATERSDTGADYPGTANDFGKGAQFATTTNCDSATFGSDTLYCANQILP
jgi:hypothetical protein